MAGSFFGYRQTDIDEPKGKLITFVVLALVASFTFLSGPNLWLALGSLALATLAAYLSLSKDDSTRFERTPYNQISEVNTKKLTVIVGFTVIVLALRGVPIITQSNTTMAVTAPTSSKQPVTPSISEPIAERTNKRLIALYNNQNIPEDVRKQLRLQCLHKTKEFIIRSVTRYIKPNAPFTSLDYPNQWNLGGSFIYAGNELLWQIYVQNTAARVAFPDVAITPLKKVKNML